MKIKVDYQEQLEQLEMLNIEDYDAKTNNFRPMIVNLGGRHLPF